LLTDEYQRGSNDVTSQLLNRHAAEFNNFPPNNKAGSTILTQEQWQSMAQQCPQPVQLQKISLWMPQHAYWLIFCLEGKPFALLAIQRFSMKCV
jgi:hypothetical protein